MEKYSGDIINEEVMVNLTPEEINIINNIEDVLNMNFNKLESECFRKKQIQLKPASSQLKVSNINNSTSIETMEKCYFCKNISIRSTICLVCNSIFLCDKCDLEHIHPTLNIKKNKEYLNNSVYRNNFVNYYIKGYSGINENNKKYFLNLLDKKIPVENIFEEFIEQIKIKAIFALEVTKYDIYPEESFRINLKIYNQSKIPFPDDIKIIYDMNNKKLSLMQEPISQIEGKRNEYYSIITISATAFTKISKAECIFQLSSDSINIISEPQIITIRLRIQIDKRLLCKTTNDSILGLSEGKKKKLLQLYEMYDDIDIEGLFNDINKMGWDTESYIDEHFK